MAQNASTSEIFPFLPHKKATNFPNALFCMANSRLEGGRERRSEMASQKTRLFSMRNANEVQRSQVEPIWVFPKIVVSNNHGFSY